MSDDEPYGEGWVWLMAQSGNGARAVESTLRSWFKELRRLRSQLVVQPRLLTITAEELEIIEELRKATA